MSKNSRASQYEIKVKFPIEDVPNSEVATQALYRRSPEDWNWYCVCNHAGMAYPTTVRVSTHSPA